MTNAYPTYVTDSAPTDTWSSISNIEVYGDSTVQVYVFTPSNDNTATTTDSLRCKVLYRVKGGTTYSISQTSQEASGWVAPTKWELSDVASVLGCLALRAKHSRVPKSALGARTNYQGMARLPCYRKTRAR
jgi:hypothetical protein